MSAFTHQKDWSRREGEKYVTVLPLPWEVGVKGSGLWLRVPPGFVFDLSIPRALRWLFDPHAAKFRKPGALHDYALHLGWDRVSAAAAFADALKASGVGRMERLVLVLAVILWRWS